MVAEYYNKRGVCYDDVRQHEKIFLIYTYKCTAACEHCLTESDPRKNEKLNVAVCLQILETGVKFGKRWLMISGGEPFLYRSELQTVLARAKELGYYCCIGTNAYWAKTESIAKRELLKLKDAGLDAIFPSATAYHAKYVPIQRVATAKDVAAKIGLVCEINFYPSPDRSTDEQITSMLGLSETGWYTDGLITTGRDVSDLEPFFKRRLPAELDDCGSVHMAFTPHGDAICNCNVTYRCDEFMNSPFYLGNVHSDPLETIFDRERSSPILQLMMRESKNVLHEILATDYEVGGIYKASEATRTYFSATAFYLDVLQNPLYKAAIERAAHKFGIA